MVYRRQLFLGPIFFLICINDIVASIKGYNTKVSVDNTMLHLIGTNSNINKVIVQVNALLHNIYRYLYMLII